ncbi:transcription elongation factor GreA [Mesoaciditoga sp.]
MKEKIVLTKEGYESLKKELGELRERLMNDVAQKIKEAREYGDLSENSEYDEAKNEQGKINSRITEIEEILSHAVVVEENKDIHEVNIGSIVKLKDLNTGKEMKVMVVTSQESDIFKNKISVDSPLGEAIYKRHLGETVRIKAPNGTKKYLIMDVTTGTL